MPLTPGQITSVPPSTQSAAASTTRPTKEDEAEEAPAEVCAEGGAQVDEAGAGAGAHNLVQNFSCSEGA